VIAVHPSISGKDFPEPEQEIAFYDQRLDKLRNSPGIEAAAAIDSLPLEGGSNQPIQIEGHPVQAMADQPEVSVRMITPQYLKTMQIPLLRGRDFGDQDRVGSPGTILISQALAQRFWPNENPIGRHVTMTFFAEPPREIVGIVGDVKDRGLDSAKPEAMLYLPLGQMHAPKDAAYRSYPLWIVARSSNLDAATPEVIHAVHQLNSAMPIMETTTMDDFLADSLSQQRFNMLLLAAFAGIALFLAAIGTYSVLAYAVRRRTREIGIRMALGAQTGDVVGMILAEAMKPTFIGVAIGVAGALAMGRVISSLIYGVKASDVTTFTTVSLILIGVSLLASLVPAFRATRVNPVTTLREE
jgi:putative ABC transport system permease protein